MKKVSRRQFLKHGAILGGAIGFPAVIPASALGRDGSVPPSERVTIGLIGCGNRSRFAAGFHDYDKSQIVAVCDPFKERRLHKKQEYGNCPDFNDFRELLELDSVDAVYICTAEYWHLPMSIAAAKAGKDMYVEKPLGLSIEQDLAARQIVDKYKRIFQYGTQNRSIAQVRMGTELVLNGHIGEVRECYAWAPKGFSGGSATPVLPVPEGFDYDMWLGPAPEAPFCADRCLRSGQGKGVFHIRDYSIGFLAGWGAHPLDQLQWWADAEGLGIPVRYEGSGKIPSGGLFNTVTHWDMTCTYAGGVRVRFCDQQTARQQKIVPHIDEIPFDHGTMYVGTKGWMAVSRGSWKCDPPELLKRGKAPGERRLPVSIGHPQNFVDCVLARKQPISDLDSAILSDTVSHLCEICIRAGRPIAWDADKNTIVGDEEAQAMMSRPMRKPWAL